LRPTHSYMAARAGRYSVSGKTTAADARTFETNGTITLHHDASVSGMLTDGPLAGGSWDPKQLSFLLIYNAELPFLYSLRIRSPKKAKKAADNEDGRDGEASAGADAAVRCKGSWVLDGPRGVDDSYHGTIKLTLTWEADIAPPPTEAAATAPAAPLLALPLPGSDGNRACEVRPVTALAVPCSMCGEEDANLSFFDMVVPHFGTAELVSFTCAACGYKYNKVGTAVGQKAGPKGKVLRLNVSSGADLRREVVVSDVATVRLPAVEVEVQAVGRYTTVEGLVTGLASGLARAALVSGGDDAEASATGGAGVGSVVGSLEARINALLEGCETCPFSVEISDPLALSFIAELPAAATSVEEDGDGAAGAAGGGGGGGGSGGGPLEVEEWERSAEEDLELGLVDAAAAGEQLWRDADAAADGVPVLGSTRVGDGGLTGNVDTYASPACPLSLPPPARAPPFC
jgi:C4-type Zn-finger protein